MMNGQIVLELVVADVLVSGVGHSLGPGQTMMMMVSGGART